MFLISRPIKSIWLSKAFENIRITTNIFDIFRIITLKQQNFSQSDPVLIRQFLKKFLSDPVLIRPKSASVVIQSDPVLIRAHLWSVGRNMNGYWTPRLVRCSLGLLLWDYSEKWYQKRDWLQNADSSFCDFLGGKRLIALAEMARSKIFQTRTALSLQHPAH